MYKNFKILDLGCWYVPLFAFTFLHFLCFSFLLYISPFFPSISMSASCFFLSFYWNLLRGMISELQFKFSNWSQFFVVKWPITDGTYSLRKWVFGIWQIFEVFLFILFLFLIFNSRFCSLSIHFSVRSPSIFLESEQVSQICPKKKKTIWALLRMFRFLLSYVKMSMFDDSWCMRNRFEVYGPYYLLSLMLWPLHLIMNGLWLLQDLLKFITV